MVRSSCYELLLRLDIIAKLKFYWQLLTVLFYGDVSAVDVPLSFDPLQSSRFIANWRTIYEQSIIDLSLNIDAIAGRLYAAFFYSGQSSLLDIMRLKNIAMFSDSLRNTG
jgi:hypothetical protein